MLMHVKAFYFSCILKVPSYHLEMEYPNMHLGRKVHILVFLRFLSSAVTPDSYFQLHNLRADNQYFVNILVFLMTARANG
mgnify:CR=1 FL=1